MRLHKLIKFAAVLLPLFLLIAETQGQSALDGFNPNANNTVSSVAVQADGKILIGGHFTTLSPNGGGPVTRNRIARLNPDGTLDTTFNPNANGAVYSIMVQADGKILVGGAFTTLSPNGGGPVTRNRIARLNPDGTLDTTFNPNANDVVSAIAVQADGKILAGGSFSGADSIGGQARNRIARLDAVSGLADSFDPNANNPVSTIVVQENGRILAGGVFSSIGGQIRNRIARLDATSGLADSFDPNANGKVISIAIQPDGKILVGGFFGSMGGQARFNIARLDVTTGLADSFNPSANLDVTSIVVQADGKILAGGLFTAVGGQTRRGIARLDPTTGLADSFANGTENRDILSIAVQADGKILAGGSFLAIGGQTRNNIARLEIDGGLDRTLDLNAVGNWVIAMAAQPDGKILIGGSFATVLGVVRNNIARLNRDGTLDPAFDPNANDTVWSIAMQADGKILVGGRFISIGGQARNAIARLDLTTGLADSFNPGANNTVRSITVRPDTKILVGGDFTTIGGQTHNHIAQLDPVTGLADSFDPNADGSVVTIGVQADGKILAGGVFTSIGGQTRSRIARLDPTTGLCDSFDPSANGTVWSIAIDAEGRILAGGDFAGANSIGGQTRNRIARLDATTGLADPLDPNSNDRIYSIALQANGKILAGGNFTSIGSQTRNRIARLDGATGLADSFNPNANDVVYSVALQPDGKILAGGEFASAGGQARNLFARLTNDDAALQNLTVTPTTITWTRGGSSPQLRRATFEYSTDNVSYTPLGSGSAVGSSWTLTGLSFPSGQNNYVRARGYYRSGYVTGSESTTESVRDAFFAVPGPTPTPIPFSDLQVTSVTAPGQAFTDSSFDVSWIDSNKGEGQASGPWTDKIFLSTDAQLGNDTLLADVSFTGSLESGQSVARTRAVNVPRSVIPSDGTYYLIVLTDANDNVPESNENNNWRAIPITINRTLLPDLTVQSIEAPDPAFFGQTINVRWTVANIGAGSTNASQWSDRFYLSIDQSGTNPAVVLNVANVSFLGPQESYVGSADVTLPRGIFGTYYVILDTNVGHSVVEENYSNNRLTRPIQIEVPPLPDLQVEFVQAPEKTFAGESISINFRVENHGTGNTPPNESSWTDGIYLSPTQTFDPSTARFIGSRNHTGGLVQNDGYTVNNFSVNVPSNIAGDWWVFVVTDYLNRVYEFVNENNNSNHDSKHALHIVATPPDLTVSNIGVTGDPIAGRPLTIAWTVRNQGAFDAAPAWFDSVYLTAGSTPNPAQDTRLISLFHQVSLGPGLTYDASAVVSLPNCLDGPFRLYVFTDSSNQVFEWDPKLDAEANNFSPLQTLQVVSIPPDLKVTSVTNPAIGNAGQAMPVSWTVTNLGLGPTTEDAWTDTVYLNRSATFNASTALRLGDFTHNGNLTLNDSYERTENVVVPTTAVGIYYVFVVTNSGSSVSECGAGANNNATASSTLVTIGNTVVPDLQITNVNIPASALAGETITIQWSGINAGNIPVPNSAWNDAVYFSTNATLDASDTRLAVRLVPGPLAPSATYSAQAQVTIPSVSAGAYYLIVKADDGNFVFEGPYEDNNTNPAALPILSPSVDLQVPVVSLPAIAFSGQDTMVNWTVTNNGTMPTFATSWTDRIYLSRDQILQPADPVIGFVRHNGALAGGANYEAALGALIPPGLSGPYYVSVGTDAHNEVAETNEANNLSAPRPVTLQIPPPCDLIVGNVEIPNTGSPGEQAAIQWTVTNQGANAAGGRWTDAIYLSTDSTWDSSDPLAGRVEHNGDLPVGQNYVGQLTTALPSVDPGPYYVIIRTDVRNQVRESDDTNNTGTSGGTINIDVPELQLGVPYNSTLQTGQERYHKVNAPGNETLLYTLTAEGQGTATELFARRGSMPSRSAFDFLFSRPGEANQEIVIPDTQSGFYYDLVRGANVPDGTVPSSIKAEVIPFSIRSVSPTRIGDNGQVTITLKGARFQSGATVRLVSNDTTLTAALVMVPDSATAKARFFFIDAPHGVYDVELANPGGNATTAQQAVTIETAMPVSVRIDTIGNTAPRLGARLSLSSVLRNTGNVDAPYVSVVALFEQSTGQPTIGIARPDTTLPRPSDEPEANWAEDSPTSIHFGTTTGDGFVVRDLEPNEELPFRVTVRGYRAGPYNLTIGAKANLAGDFYSLMQTSAPGVRQALLASNIQMPTEIAQALATEESWWQFISGVLTNAGWLSQLEGFDRGPSRAPSLTLPDAGPFPPIDCEKCHPILVGCEGVENAILIFCMSGARTLPTLLFCVLHRFGPHMVPTACDAVKLLCIFECQGRPPTQCEILSIVVGPFFGSQTRCSIPVPRDPNEKLGPTGFGPQAFVGSKQAQLYTVYFENVPDANAPAQRIRITDLIDQDLDPRTLRLKEIGFGNYRITVPENRAFYQNRIQLGPDLGNLFADIVAGVDLATGQVIWTLTAIDPQTGEQPTDASLGLLPPNDDTGRGQGYVTYTIQPKATAKTGAEITNNARITFDVNEAITTNTVFNTLDADAPASAVASLPAISPPTFTLSWAGKDPPGGSGLRSFDIWVSEDNGPYQPFVTGTTEHSSEFTGQVGRIYRFYSTAADNAGNAEATPLKPDAITTIVGATPTPIPVRLGNISTRLRVETGDNVLIGGFIVTGTQSKRVILRGIGPSLASAGVPNALTNPILELHSSSGLLASNDNWMDAPNRQEIIDTGIAPTNDFESAILMTLPANNSAYTAVMEGVNNSTGVGLVEVYDLDDAAPSKLANISTRGLVQTAENVMIGGFIVVGQTSTRVIVRAIGPSLAVPGKLADPNLELRDGNGTLIQENNNWRTGGQEAEIIATGIPPSDDLEAAIVRALAPGAYTAIVGGQGDATGVALVEVYDLGPP